MIDIILLEKLFSKLGNIFDKEKEINVLMLGHRGVGKTTILASLYYEFSKNLFNKSISLRADSNTRENLSKASTDLKEQLQLDDFIFEHKLKGTTGINRYNFYLEDKEKTKIVDLKFTDIAGGDVIGNTDKIGVEIKKSDIILIPIDATAMIEKDEEGVNYHDRINKPEEIEILLGEIIQTDKEKMVIFIPVKSESYFEKLSDLERIFNQKYKSILDKLKNKDNILTLYIPIKTIGDIKFKEIQKKEKTPLYIFKPLKFDASYNPEYVEQIFILILLFTFAQKYKNAKFWETKLKKDLEEIYKEYRKELKDDIVRYKSNSRILNLK